MKELINMARWLTQKKLEETGIDQDSYAEELANTLMTFKDQDQDLVELGYHAGFWDAFYHGGKSDEA